MLADVMKSHHKIVLVDDDVFVRSAIATLIKKSFPSADIATCGTVETAFQVINEICPELIILDLSIGKQSGLTVVRQLRLAKITIPILILSSLRDEEAALTCLRAGVDGFLCKDFAIETNKLAQAMITVLNGGKYLSEALAARLIEMPGNTETEALSKLSRQETQVLLLMARGSAVKEVAGLMSVSEKSIRTYRSRLMQKLELKSDADIVRFAIQNGLLA